MSVVNDECSICAGSLEGDTTVLECGHCFHVGCVIQWFRYYNTTCPNCRSERCSELWTRKTPAQRVSHIRRRRNNPKRVQNLIQRLDECRATQKSMSRSAKEIYRANREIFKTHRKLESGVCTHRRRERLLVRQIDSLCAIGPFLEYHGSIVDDNSGERTDSDEHDVE